MKNQLNAKIATLRANQFKVNPVATSDVNEAIDFYRLDNGQIVISKHQSSNDTNFPLGLFQSRQEKVTVWEKSYTGRSRRVCKERTKRASSVKSMAGEKNTAILWGDKWTRSGMGYDMCIASLVSQQGYTYILD